jgi:hypothetical protein
MKILVEVSGEINSVNVEMEKDGVTLRMTAPPSPEQCRFIAVAFLKLAEAQIKAMH